MNNLGGNTDNIHLGDTEIFGDLTVTEDFILKGEFEVVGDLVVAPPNCVISNCIKPATLSGSLDIKNNSGSTIAQFNDDQSIGAFSIYGESGGLLLSSDSGGQAVLQLNQGTGIPTAGCRLINTKLNVDEIQSQSHEISGSNPKILFTASKVEITGDTATEFETKTILTSEIKKDDTGGNMIIKAADGTQIIRTDDNLKELYVGEDATGYRMPKLRDTIGHILTMSNTGVATFEEPAQTGANTVIGTIVTPRTVYGFGSYANVALSVSGSTSVAANTWAIGDVLTIRILGEWSSTARTGGTSNFRLVVGALGSVVSSFVNPATNGTVSKQPFELSIGLTRATATTINFVGTGIFQDNDGANKPSKQFDFNSGVITGYDETLALPVDIEYIDNSTSGTGSGYVRYVAQSGIWTQSTPSSVVPVISTSDHTALSNLELGDAGHSQFALLTGRAGGQTLSGGSSLSSEDLIIGANSIDPTSGYVKIQSDVIMSDQTIRGSQAPGGFLRLSSTSDGTKGQILMLDEVLASANVNMDGNNIINAAEIQAIGAQALKMFGAPNIELYGSSSPGSGTIELKTNTTSVYNVNTTLAPTTGDNLCNKTYVDGKAAEYLPLTGGALTDSMSIPSNGTDVYGFTGNPTFGMSSDGNCICFQAANSRLILLDGGGNTFRPSNSNSGAISLGRDASKWNDLFLAGDIKCDGDANISGDLKVDSKAIIGGTQLVGYIEPMFDNPALISSRITKTDRNYDKANVAADTSLAYDPDVITCGTTAENYRLIIRLNSTGSNFMTGLADFNGGLNVAVPSPHILFGTDSTGGIGVLLESTPGGTEDVNTVASYNIAASDYFEWRLTNICQDFRVYYHGQSLISTPTLIYQRTGMTMSGVQCFLGDTTTTASTFNIDTIEANGLNVSEDVYIDKGLTVVEDLSVVGTISGDAGSAWAFYSGTDYDTPVEMKVGVKTSLLCNGLGTGGFTDQLPLSGHNFWNITTSIIEPEFSGDCYDLELRIDAENDNKDGYYILELDIGTGGSVLIIPLAVIRFPKGANTTHSFSKTTLIFAKDTFKTTGGTIYLTSGLGDTTVSSFDVLISRNHRAR